MPGAHFGEVEFHLVESGLFQANPVCSRQFLVFSGFPWDIWLNLESSAPGVYHLLWSPDLDEGSPTGHLWWSLTGGEVTYMCHILRGKCEP